MKSIRIKLIIYFCIVTLFVSITYGVISINTTRKAVTAEVDKALELLAVEGSKVIYTRIDSEYVFLEGIATRELISNENIPLEQKLEYLNQITDGNSDYIRMGIVNTSGYLHFTDSFRTNIEGTNVNSRQYFTDSMAGRRGMLPPTISVNPADNGSLVVALSTPIYHNRKIIGVLVAVKNADFLNVLSSDMGFGNSGYAYILNGEGTLIAHLDTDKVLNQFNPIKEVENDPSLKSLADEFQNMLSNKRGYSNYKFNGRNMYAGYAPIKGTDWIMSITADESEVLSALPALQRNILIYSIIVQLLSMIVCYFVGNSIVKPIISIIGHSKKISDLDVTEDVPKDLLDKKDEVGSLAMAFQTITVNLREFLKQVVDTSAQVASSAEQLTATSQQSAVAAEEVARSIEEIAKSTNEQAKDIETGVQKTDELNQNIEEDLQYMKQINKAMEELTTLKDDGVEIIKGLTHRTKNSDKAIQTIYEGTMETNESARKIGEASQLIRGIAEQTNLLALNAAIESARAGEAGKGFAVVADEIRKLAEQSTNSAKEIDIMLSKLQDNSQNAVTIMEDVITIIKEQVQSVGITETKFDGIAQQIESVKDILSKSMNAVDAMYLNKNDLADIMQNLAAISEENAAGTEETSASVEEQTAAMAEIAQSSEMLAGLAESLQKNIAKFKF